MVKEKDLKQFGISKVLFCILFTTLFLVKISLCLNYDYDFFTFESEGISFSENFEQSSDVILLSEKSNWKITSEGSLEVKLEERGWSCQLFNNTKSDDCKISAKVYVDYSSGGPSRWIGICFRCKSAVNYNRQFYLFVIDALDGELRLENYKGDYKTRDILAKKLSGVTNSGWHILSIEAKVNKISAYFDNNLVFEVEDETHKNGYAGLYQMLGTGILPQKLSKLNADLKNSDKDISANAKYKLAMLEGQNVNKASSIQQFNSVINNLEEVKDINPGSDIARKAMLNAAYFKSDREIVAIVDPEERFEKRKKAFITVSELYPGTKEGREALFRVGMLYRGKGSQFKEQALSIFKEVVKTSPQEDEIKAMAQCHLAAMVLEKAYDGISAYDDAITECKKVLNINSAQAEDLATAKIMIAEALYFKNLYNDSIQWANDIIEKFPLQRHQSMMAQFYIGMSYMALEKFDQALSTFQNVLDNYDEQDNWPNNNVHAWAMNYMSKIYLKQNNFYKAKELLKKLSDSYPESKYGQDAKSLLSTMN